jgi:hypothetical protein
MFSNVDFVAAYEDAMAEGNYELALAIQMDMSQAQAQLAAQQAFAAGQADGYGQGFGEGVQAAQPPEPEKTPEQRAAEGILKAYRDGQGAYKHKVLKGHD